MVAEISETNLDDKSVNTTSTVSDSGLEKRRATMIFKGKFLYFTTPVYLMVFGYIYVSALTSHSPLSL